MIIESCGSHTDWGVFDHLKDADEQQAELALNRIVRRYWPSVYAFLRGSGLSVHEAADLTQEFVCEVLLKKDLLIRADPQRGRFRSLLLTSVRNFVISHKRKAAKRRTRTGVESEELGRLGIDSQTPVDAFNAQWATTIIRRVIDRLRKRCQFDGMTEHWEVFEHRVLRPLLVGDAPVEYAILVKRLDLESAAQATNMVVTVKRLFAQELRHEIRMTLDDPSDFASELAELFRGLEGNRQ